MRRAQRACGLVLVGGLGACSSPSPSAADGKVASPSVAPGSEPDAAQCRPSTAVGVWARFDGDSCGWELRDDGDGLALHGLMPEAPPPARGEVPVPCRERTCVYHGAVTGVGPVLLVVVPSSHSGMPSDVQLGVPDAERLSFVSLWDGAGEPVMTDFTRVGPAHALAPFVCGDGLALLAVERLEAGRGLAPPHTLRAREGRVDPAILGEPAAEVDRDGCSPVDLPVF